MKVQLIQASSQDKNLMNDPWVTPLNLIALGTYLENNCDVEVIDGLHVGLEDTLKRLDGDVVGIYFNIFSTPDLDKIAESAKNRGSLVVVGGQPATPLARQLLHGNKNTDIVVRYDGEEALRQIVERRKQGSNDFTGIPNIVYRKNGDIIEEKVEKLDVTKLPIPNRRINGINLEDYIASWPGASRPTNTYTKKGCERACSFCARTDKKIRSRTPKQVFEEDEMLVDEFGINYILEMSDTYFTDITWLRRFREIHDKNGGLPVRYWAFCDIRDVNPETVGIMRNVNVGGTCIGLESGNEEIRRKNGKPFTNEQIYNAVEQLGKAGITLEDSYILGLIGENEETVKQTYQLSKQVAQLCETEGTSFSLILPLPGSPIWRRMMQVPELKAKYGDKYKFNVEELRKDYIDNFCFLSC
jgi:radical SAM superfamily enzyme YgiQ (UPF0313 family)